MKKIILSMVCVMLMAFSVSAISCSSQFSSAASDRVRVAADSNSLSITANRLSNSINDLYNYIDDLHSNENLTSLDSDFTDLSDRKNDMSDDIKNLADDLSSYDNTVSDSRHNMPNECLNIYTLYDKDVSNVKDWDRDVKKYYDRFYAKYSTVSNFHNNLAHINASYARPSMDALQNAMDDLTNSIGNGINFNINNTVVVNMTYYNQTQCFAMITKNVDIAVKGATDKCNQILTKQLQNCTQSSPSTTLQCPVCQSCDSLVFAERQNTQNCMDQLNSQTTQTTKTTLKPTDCSASDAQNIALTKQLQDLKTSMTNSTVQIDDLTKQLAVANAAKGQSCLIYQIAIVALVFLILFAWIFTM